VKQLVYLEERKLFISMIALSLIAFLVAALLLIAMMIYTNQELKDSYAGIVGTVVQSYPEAEAQIMQGLGSPEVDALNLGNQVLEKYGLGNQSTSDTAVAASLLARLLPATLTLIGLVCAGFVLLLMRYQRAVSGQVAGLSEYLRRIESGDYSLDVRDNGEGNFSLLKNDLYKVTVRLREQAELLQKDKTALSNLVADISHQIKTPLTSLGVLVDLLADDPPETERRSFVERLRMQLGRIQWLIVALLRLARLDAGTAAFRSESVALGELVRRALLPLQIPIEIKNQRLNIRGDEAAGFVGDLNWSTEALTNVVKNCIEHTPEDGTIEITYHANALYAEIVVSDNGEGIATRDLPNIFNRFYRSESADENSVGIGLALAKAILNAQGGDITVSSQPGAGTSFSIRVFHGVV
jgi:signal transduction histidine kinase